MTPEEELEGLREENAFLRKEIERLGGLLGTPEMEDFLKGVEREAAYQKERWGEDHDRMKTADNWFWTLGWLAGKAVNDPHDADDKRTPKERRLHRIITAAALLFHWHEAARKEA